MYLWGESSYRKKIVWGPGIRRWNLSSVFFLFGQVPLQGTSLLTCDIHMFNSSRQPFERGIEQESDSVGTVQYKDTGWLATNSWTFDLKFDTKRN